MKLTMKSGVVVIVSAAEHVLIPLEGNDGDLFYPNEQNHWETERARFCHVGQKYLAAWRIETISNIN